jgi:hypothetical protein
LSVAVVGAPGGAACSLPLDLKKINSAPSLPPSLRPPARPFVILKNASYFNTAASYPDHQVESKVPCTTPPGKQAGRLH